MVLEHDSGVGDGEPQRCDVAIDGHTVATGFHASTERCLTVRMGTVDPARLGRAEADVILDGIIARARASDLSEVDFDSGDLLLRHQARGRGFQGPLRGPLRAVVGTQRAMGERQDADDRARAEWLADMLAELVPGVSAHPEPRPGAFRRLARAGVTGLCNSVRVVVALPRDDLSLTVTTPDRPDVMAEAVALACDTALAILRCFPGEANVLHAISFDRSYHGFISGSTRGVAHRELGSIHINAALVTGDAFTGYPNWRAGPPPPFSAPPSDLRWWAIDKLTAHEVWHHVERAFEARRYRESIEFRCLLGRAFGVERLEQAVNGGQAGAPVHWKGAYDRLRHEVSNYATTNCAEATAELFATWWCRPSEAGPAVRSFGDALARFFPALPDLGRRV